MVLSHFGKNGIIEHPDLDCCFLNRYSVHLATFGVQPKAMQRDISLLLLAVYKINLVSRHYLQKIYPGSSLHIR